MSPLIKKTLIWTILPAIAAGTAYYAYNVANVDPFATFRTKKPLGGEIGIRMKDVDFEVHDGKEKLLNGKVSTVEVSNDRLMYEFLDLTGTAGSEKDNKVDFASKKASYDSISRQLHFNTGTSIEGRDFALFAPKALYSERDQQMSMPQTAGTVFNGKMLASAISYSVPTSELRSKKIHWNGKLPAVFQDTPVGQAPQGKSGWDFRSEKDQVWNSKKKVVSMQSVRATDGDVLIRAEIAEWDQAKDILTCSGKVYYYSEKANFVADKATIYRKEKRAVLGGDIRMLMKSKGQANLSEEIPPFRPDVPDNISEGRPAAPTSEEVQQQKDLDAALRSAENLREYPAIIIAKQVEYWYPKGNTRAVITGNPECLQDFPGNRWRRVTADIAKYDGQADTLRLESSGAKKSVRVKTSIGDNILASWGLFSVKDDETDPQDWELASPEGRFMADDDEIPKKDPPPAKEETKSVPPKQLDSKPTASSEKSSATGKEPTKPPKINP